jgi:two-component system sensor kinase FixL
MNEWSGRPAIRGSDRVAILAEDPETGRLCELLCDAAGDCVGVDAEALAEGIRNGSLAVAIVDPATVSPEDAETIMSALDAQPPWSDFPFVLVVDRESLGAATSLANRLGHAMFVERPLEAAMLRNAALAALRSRLRQHEAEAYLLQRTAIEEHLRQLTGTLEMRVRERMSDLRAANERLVREGQERQAAEERLRESEELYRYTVELSRQMVWTATPEGRMVTVNRRFFEVTGVPEETAPHEAWLQVLHPEESEAVLGSWMEVLGSGEPYHMQFRMRVADGTYRTFVARAAPRLDEEKRVIRWYGFTEDVTEQERADSARREAEERYRLAARATNDAIWDLDVIAGHIQWTASETAFFGYAETEQTPLQWWGERVHPDDHDRVYQGLEQAIRGEDSHWEDSYRFLMASGNYADVFDQGFIIRNAKGLAIRAVGAMSDLTDHKRAEAEIRRIQAELIHVSRLSAMGTLASTLAHELNQPLTAVSSFIRGSRRLLGQQPGAGMDQVRDALEAAENAALRAGHILKRLRELVARGNVSPRAERLAKVVQDASMIAFVDEHLLGATHRIELDPAAEWVEVDAVQIQQVLINLVRNALQAMQDQPRREIVIRTSVCSSGTVEVSVADTGPGIPAGIREELFSPFQSTKVEGMGIGLSISRTIVEAHGGRIWAEESLGGGAIFRFTLPRAQAPEAEETA